MPQLASATGALFRDRDLFVHDGARLRRFRVSAPVQAVLFVALMILVGWSGYAAARLVAGSAQVAASTDLASLAAATEARARKLEQRQALLAAMLAGENVDDRAIAAASASSDVPGAVAAPLDRAEANQDALALAAARKLEQRYSVAAAELKRLGINPDRLGGGVGGPLEPAAKGDPTFRQLFMSWKKLDNLQDGAIAVPSEKPVKLAAFTSGFGMRADPFQGRAAMHAGIDLSGPVGTPIYATADGVVTSAGWHNGGYGNLIKIDHGKGIETRYAHLSSLSVREGQRIRRGEMIGRMGSTGRSTGSHLHYEVRIDGRAVNPIPFMKSTDYLLAMRNKAHGAAMDQVALGGPEKR
ncbi:MAG TPA: M23 family metallopeptidase [Sphingomicrobium sp.]|nr:M23 family metallopeptidase [Sphingomicrobium sp.]